MSTTKVGLRADAVRNRQRTLEATKALLADPDATITVEAIAAQAGVGAATVVRAFGGKEALIDAAVSSLLAPLVQRARDLLSGMGPEEALRTFLVELIAFQAAHHAMNAQLGELNLPATEAEEAGLRQVILDMVTQARETGTIRTDLDPTVTVTLIGECTYAIARSRTTSPELPGSYVSVLMDGLRPQPRRSG
ncbi:TetR/AcrR family transcriptional regulator [Sphaerisporangium perillae]|uniref:TetR/AcrR family transcriptional regulator n=1 Tax=Sphaerisporangium perillae TaxID=2935860 RepID=UPI00200BC61B|nr:TetR/AcrR family transcriptional regulator [Sphaerisporangium perillae]